MNWSICIAFPSSQSRLCNSIANYINSDFETECNIIIYDLSKEKIDQILSILNEKCIFIIGYEGKISLENCYKLGLIHAYNVQVVLINLSPKLDRNKIYIDSGIPKYVRHHYLITFDPQSTIGFRGKIRNTLSALLSGSLIEALYRKAVDICDDLENRGNCSIRKVDIVSFESKLLSLSKNERDSLYSLYINNDDKLYDVLINALAEYEDIEIIWRIINLSSLQANDEVISENRGNTIILRQENYHQYGNNDNFGGNRIDENII